MRTFKNILFYMLSFTWGIITSVIGILMILFLIPFGYLPKRFNNRIYTPLKGSWGGFEMGPFFFTDAAPSLCIKQHEAGHGIQNIILGPLMLPLVSIPSCIRYWLREMKTLKGKYIYAGVLEGLAIVISLLLLVFGAIFNNIILIMLSSLLLIYSVVVSAWLFFAEIPQYFDGTEPSYDSIWFEGWATQLGKKYYPEDR